jgi:hypothetical protein
LPAKSGLRDRLSSSAAPTRLATSRDLWFIGTSGTRIRAGEQIAAIDEMERWVRFIESEVKSEKTLTRSISRQFRRGSIALPRK